MVRLSKGLMPGESAAALRSAPAGPFWRESDWEAATRPPAGESDLAELAAANSVDPLRLRGRGGPLLRPGHYTISLS